MVGVKTASERLRQRSASSPASSSASGGARVRARVEEGDNDRSESCIYRDRGGTALLCRYPWRFAFEALHYCDLFHVPRTPKLSGGRSFFSGSYVEE